jgi:5-methylcytosine-specific restriction protein A
MKLMNFRACDPSYTGTGRVGLQRGGKLDREVWDEFSRDREYLAAIAATIRAAAPGSGSKLPPSQEDPDDEEGQFPEGKLVYRLHRKRERSAELVRRSKAHALKKYGALRCIACQFDFGLCYGALGHGFIEVHHTKPLSEVGSQRATRLADVVLLCSNCHRMVHRRRPWLKLFELGRLLDRAS